MIKLKRLLKRQTSKKKVKVAILHTENKRILIRDLTILLDYITSEFIEANRSCTLQFKEVKEDYVNSLDNYIG